MQAGSPGPTPSAREAAPAQAGTTARRFVAWFEYEGTTALTVVGPATQRRYRFDGPGARVAVDLRDRPSVLRVPKLREVWQA